MSNIKPIVRGGFFVALFLFIPFWACKGQEITPDFTGVIKPEYKDEVQLNYDYNSILDYKNYDQCLEKQEGVCVKTERAIQYLYITSETVKFLDNEDYFSITENSRTFVGPGGERTIRIYSGQPFIKVNGEWYETGIGITTETLWNATVSESLSRARFDDWNPFKIYRVEAQTYYPNTLDGDVFRSDTAAWSTVRSNTGETVDDDATYFSPINYYETTGPRSDIHRAVFCFNTYVAEGCEVDTAVFKVMSYNNGQYDQDNDGKDYYTLATATPAGTDELLTSDYDLGTKIGSTKISDDIDLTGWTNNTRYTWTLNATGEAFIDDAGYTCLAMREGHDWENEAVCNGCNVGSSMFASEEAGTANDPYLEITCSEEAEEPTATTTVSCTPDNLNDLAFITACSFASSTGVTYTNYHFPFLVWVILVIPLLWVGQRIIIEFVIRWRGMARYK